MKPTTESIKAVYDLAGTIQDKGMIATIKACEARIAFETGSPNLAVDLLKFARKELVTLRRTQTAALKNIDDAIASAKGGGK